MAHFTIDRLVTRALLRDFQEDQHDVLGTEFARRKRSANLFKAVSLESIYQRKVLLWIEGETCCYPVATRITALGDRMVILERDIPVPISSICHISFEDASGALFS